MRNTICHLLNCYFLDSNYNHTIDFKNRTNQYNFFISKKIKSLGEISYHRIENGISLPYHIDSVELCNYVMIKNEGERLWRYYFVINKKYINDNNTLLSLKLDVIQTYLLDVNFNDCLIERQHIKRFVNGKINFNDCLEDENLETGEYIIKNKEQLYTYKNKGGYVTTSSDKLGKLIGDSGGSTNPPSSEKWRNGELSPSGFRFLKGFEGFGAIPYDDGYGYNTIAYGITEHGEPTIYKELADKSPISEQEGARKSYDCMNIKYGIAVKNEIDNLYISNQSEFDALVSFVYNLGTSVLMDSDLRTALKSRNETAIRTEWMKYVNANGSPSEGLIKRREQELNIFFNYKYDFKPITIVGTGTYVTENSGHGWLPSL